MSFKEGFILPLRNAPYLKSFYKEAWLIFLLSIVPWAFLFWQNFPENSARLALSLGGSFLALSFTPKHFKNNFCLGFWAMLASLVALCLPTSLGLSLLGGLVSGLLVSLPLLVKAPVPKFLWPTLVVFLASLLSGENLSLNFFWPYLLFWLPLLIYFKKNVFFIFWLSPVLIISLIFQKPLLGVIWWFLFLAEPSVMNKKKLALALMLYLASLFLSPLASLLSLTFIVIVSEFWAQKGQDSLEIKALEPRAKSLGKAFIHCAHHGQALRAAKYEGFESCYLAALNDHGFYHCQNACLGFGDCQRHCPFQAILKNEKGDFVVYEDLCQGCGLCLEICPQKIISLGPKGLGAQIPCSSSLPMSETSKICPSACLGCSRCFKACPFGAISKRGPVGAFKIDQNICLNFSQECGKVCQKVCPKNIIL